MTDKELLELAAKAAGCRIEYINATAGGYFWFPSDGKKWNPLTDDGDRYRLAKAAKLKIDFTTGEVTGPEFKGDDGRMYRQIYALDSEEEIDRNIVRAAAEIARSNERQIGKDIE